MSQPTPTPSARASAAPAPNAAPRPVDPIAAGSPLTSSKELQSAVVMERSGTENFPVAVWFLPERIRKDLLAIYGFARMVDQIGDAATGDRLELLDALEADLEAAYSGTPSHPLMRTLSETIDRCKIPREPFVRLIGANRLDQTLEQVETWEELLAYCDLSANPVGELVLYVFGQANAQNIEWSDSVCSALQVVEHCQDVAEDCDAGRVYLPASDLEAYGCRVEELVIAPAPQAMRSVVEHQVGRARTLLRDGDPLVGALGGWAKLAVAAFTGGGLATCDALEAAGFNPNSKLVKPTKRRLLMNTLGVLKRSRSQA